MKKYNIADQFKGTHRREMPQTSDYVFRMIYGQDTEESRKALIAVLNIVLERKEDPIKSILVKNPISLGNTRHKKETIMDIRAETDAGELLNIEMQSGHLAYYPERALFYGSKLLTSTLRSGEDYDKLKKSIVVSFIDGIIFPELEGCHSTFRLLEKDCGHLLSDKLSLHFVELGKVDVTKPVAQLSPVEKLAVYLKYANDEGQADYIEEILADEEDLIMAETIYRKLTQEEIAYQEMETELRTSLARNTELLCIREEALAAGKAEGLVEGKAEGLVEGKAEGLAEGEALVSALMGRLLADNRLEDLKRATEDADYRGQLLTEYGLQQEQNPQK